MNASALFLVFLSWSQLPVMPSADQPGTVNAPAAATLRGVVDLNESRRRLGLKEPISPVEVELRQELEGWMGDPSKGPREASSIRRVKTDDRGSFRVSDLSPGLYSLEIRSGEFKLERHSLRLEAGRETVLQEPLILEPRAQLAVHLTPVSDPWHRPWRVKLLNVPLGTGEIRMLGEGETDDSGLARLRGLDAAEVRLQVQDADGRSWIEQYLEVYPGRPEIFLSVDVVAVEGRLLFGGKPLAGELSFGTTQSSTDVRMASSENGKFSGYLPNEGRWAVELLAPGDPYDAQRLRDVEVRRRPGKSYAEVEIRVPETTLNGKVLFQGEPVADAGITVVRERSAAERKSGEAGAVREAILATDSDGRFRMRGLEAGTLSILATRGNRSSEWVRFDLRESSWPSEVVLELEERQTLQGIVVHGSLPVAGAQLVARASFSDPSRNSSYIEVPTGTDGAFEMSIPAAALSLDVLVASSSRGIELMRIGKKENAWPPLIVTLGNESGTLRLPVLPAAEGRDFSSGLVFRRNGATLRWMPVIRVLTALGRLELGPGEIVLTGLAPGPWEICLESEPSSCRAGLLPPSGEMTLPSPRQRDPNSASLLGELR